mgnify:CR=1 FL=1
MELSAVSTPVGGTQGHHAAGNGVLWRILVAGLLALSVGAENVDVATVWSLALSQKMLGRVALVAACSTCRLQVVRRWPTLSLNMSFYSRRKLQA